MNAGTDAKLNLYALLFQGNYAKQAKMQIKDAKWKIE
jgi:hypothetical protein